MARTVGVAYVSFGPIGLVDLYPPSETWDGEMLPDGCWRTIGDDYQPCNQPPDDDVLGLCAAHIEGLRSPRG